jgi:hypothetical protein
MATKKKTSKIKDITGKKVTSKKKLDDVKGGMYTRPRPKTIVNGPIYSAKEDCGGNCMGSVPKATGENIDV